MSADFDQGNQRPAEQFSVLSVSFCGHESAVGLGVGEVGSAAGVELLVVGGAPVGEGVRVNVRFDDQQALATVTFADLLRTVLPLQETGGEFVSVDEQGAQSLVVRLFIPRDAQSLHLGGNCHD